MGLCPILGSPTLTVIVHCSFVMSKTRLAPLKSLSVPRLELTVATPAVKLDKMLRKELEVPISRSVFWTDNTSVLRYMKNEDKRFHTFVSNRLIVIHDGSTPDQRRYVHCEILLMPLLEGCLQRLCWKPILGEVVRISYGKMNLLGRHLPRVKKTSLMTI